MKYKIIITIDPTNDIDEIGAQQYIILAMKSMTIQQGNVVSETEVDGYSMHFTVTGELSEAKKRAISKCNCILLEYSKVT